jgi:competence protein ComEC
MDGVVLGQPARLLPLLLAAAIIGGGHCGNELDRRDPLEGMAGRMVEVSGTVLAAQQSGYCKLTLRAENGGAGSPFCGQKILVTAYGGAADPKLLVGAEVTVRGEMSLPQAARNPGCFDYRAYLATLKIRVILSCDDNDIMVIQMGRTLEGRFLNRLAVLKHTLIERVQEVSGEATAAMLAGMLFGDKSGLDEDVYEAFQKNGTAHILSVSGIHVAIVYAFIMKLLGGRKGPAAALLSAAGLFAYAALAQFAPSVIRASLMILTHIVAMLLRKRYDLLTGACAAAGGMLAFNPLQLFNMGFQLSFLAIFSMAFAIPFLDRYVAPLKSEKVKMGRGKQELSLDSLREGGAREIARKLLRGAVPLVVIQAGMAPYTAYAFNYFSAVAFFINIPVIAIAGLLIPIGVALMPLMWLDSTLFGLASSAVESLAWAMSAMNEVGYGLPWGHMVTVSPPETWLFLYYAAFFTLSSESFRIFWQRREWKRISAVALAMLCGLFAVWCAPGSGWDKSSLVFVDVGQGDCLHIRTPGGRNILIDSGGSANRAVGEKTLMPYLLKNGVGKLDLVLITHLHTDHFQGAVELSWHMGIDRLAVYEGNQLLEGDILAKTALEKGNMLYVYAGERVILDEGVHADILFPPRRGQREYERIVLADEDENKSSLLMKLDYRGVSVLMTGDLGFDGEDALLAAYNGNEGALRSSILKVGHHGSRYSTGSRFLEAVSPELAVFQVGKNTFGHPHPSVIEKIEQSGARIYRNDTSGAIMFSIDENGACKAKTMVEDG